MSLKKLKVAELQALFDANDLSYDPDWKKDELIEELTDAGITGDETASKGNARESKKDRQARLLERFNHTK